MAKTGQRGSLVFDPEDIDEDYETTGKYVVVGIYDEEDGLELSVAYGPFDKAKDASDFGTRNFQFSWVCELLGVKSPQLALVDPNQAQISDYIDPIVTD